MSFEAKEDSRYQGQPITLYQFKYGPVIYAYTDAEDDVTVQGQVYKATAVDRNEITASGTLDKSAFEVYLPHDSEISNIFKLYPPQQTVTLIVSQGHADDPDQEFLVVWTGRVINVTIEQSEAKFTCEPVSTSMRQTGLRRNYQFGCPHALYGDQCRADKAEAKTTVTAEGVSGQGVLLPADWTDPARVSKHVGGLVEWTTTDGVLQQRTILRFAADQRTALLSGDTSGLAVGMLVDVFLGCNRQVPDCADLHDNIRNFGGQPWIPLKNPIGFANLFY